MILRKDQLEASLHEEKKLIETGRLKEDSPLDFSTAFEKLCEACRKGDLKTCQELITEGANINARDQFDYTPLILASLCGHYEVVQLLLESGALCERDTFQGERCLYNALNDRIRNLLLSYDYSKSTDPLQPLAAHITSLLTTTHPKTSDILVTCPDRSFNLHKYILSARSPYFRKKLAQVPDTVSWKLPPTIPPRAFDIAIRYVYLGDIPNDVGEGPGTGYSEEQILEGIEKISKHLEISSLWQGILESSDRRLARQNRTEELERGRNQLEAWFRENILKHKVVIDSAKANAVQWDSDNAIFADVLLRADDPHGDDEESPLPSGTATPHTTSALPLGIPLVESLSITPFQRQQHSTLYPVHRAVLLRSEYFLTMFSSSFLEAQPSQHLRIIPVDCSPPVLELVLRYLYTERADIPLHYAIEVLFAADLLLIDKLKQKAAVVISTLGNGALAKASSASADRYNSVTNGVLLQPPSLYIDQNGNMTPALETEIDPFLTLRAGWSTRVPRLEEFAARFLAYRLEYYIDTPEFLDAVKESAARIKKREETDSIELVDDIRYYLSERFRLRFEDVGIEEMEERVETWSAGQKGEKVGEEGRDGAREVENEGEVVKGDGDGFEGVVRTLDGEIAGDEFAADALNYQILLGKIDALLDRLKLDA